MSATPHIERHFTASASAAVRDIVIGMADGLTVFGYIKGKFTGVKPLHSAIQTVAIGGLACVIS